MTKVELVVLIILAVIFGSLFLPINYSAQHAYGLKDLAQLKEIHTAMLTYAGSNNDQMPLPGRVRPLSMGDEDSVDNSEDIQDYSLNTTANLYSLMIMQNYFDPGLVVSPLEPSGNVLIDDDYDWEMYETEGLPWDTNFHVSLNDYDEGCNTSYAHLALCGERRTRKWRNTQSATFPMLSNRGTENGVTSGPQYENSITLKFHAPKDKWTGNVVFADNHVDFLDTFTPEGSVYFRATPESPLQGEVDNIFAAEFDEYDFHLKGNPMFDSGEPSGDAFLVICDTVTKHTVHALYD